MKPLCIYHANCADGFASAWVVHRKLGAEVDFYAASYGHAPPDVAGRDVIIVDFSYKRAVLETMALAARSVLVLDHHKSAAEDLAGLPEPIITDWIPDDNRPLALFDMNRSGAGITWDFFNPGVPRPLLIDLVEDRDLWKFNHPWSRPIHAAITSYPWDFELWDLWASPYQLNEIYAEGKGILRKHDLDVAQIVRIARREMTIGGVRVPVANCPPWMASDVGNALSEGVPFAATYYDSDSGRSFSLRSREGGADVAAVAQRYGGGGHARASGFKAVRGWEGDP